MELHQLAYFLAIADYGNMSAASTHLHVSQPAMSTALKDLEQELGFPLFDRVGKRLHINENGLYFSRRVRKIFTMLDESQATIKDNIQRRERTIVCHVDTPLRIIERRMFGHFMKEHPEVLLRMAHDRSKLLDNITVDLEIIGTKYVLEPSKTLIPVRKERYVAVLPANHPLANSTEVALQDLRHERFIIGEQTEMTETVLEMFDHAGFKPNIVAKLELFSNNLNLVKEGVGCTIAGEYTWFDGPDPDLAIIPLKGMEFGRTIYLRIPEGSVPSKAAREFFEFVKAHKDEYF